MSSHPPKPQTPAPPAQASGPDAAKVSEDARRRQARAWDFSKTIIAPTGSLAVMPAGTKSTLS